MIMEPIMGDPWHFAIWLTGAVVWAVVLLTLAAVVAFVTWQAIVATVSVARSLWRIYVGGANRNKDCTIAQHWRYAFCYEGLMRERFSEDF